MQITHYGNNRNIKTTIILKNGDAIQNIHMQCVDINEDRAILAAGVIKAVCPYVTAIWKHSNDYVHRKDTRKTKRPKRRKLLDLLQKEIN